MISKPSRHCTVELQALPPRIGQVRRIVSAQLRYWRLDALIDSAALGVTELLTNVHRHVEPDKRCTVEIALTPDRLTVSVYDSDPRVPTLRAAGASATYGRGLELVASISESWGARELDGGGKVVWFSLPAPTSAAARPAAGSPRISLRTATPGAAPEPARASSRTPVGPPALPARAPVPALAPALAARTAYGPPGPAAPHGTPDPPRRTVIR
ncbi:ATP-binding protein [Streptomyces sp. URMC 123]|uniref:ATP-binding protein n=1 Tax=Streptomyces sp. URMC 123 TaxID=3423403 RepID=UPI003F1A9D58